MHYDKKFIPYVQKCISSFSHIIICCICLFVWTVSCSDSSTQKHPGTDTQSGRLEKESKVTRGHKRIRKGLTMSETRTELPRKRIKITKTVRVALVPPDQQAIVLLHGLHRVSYDFVKMEQKLKEKFPKATIVALKSVNKNLNEKNSFSPTMVLPIQEQAVLAYEEIKQALVRNKQVVLVGHSQGGLRAFSVVKNHAHVLEKDRSIAIKKLITIGTPWKGAPVMNHLNNPNEAIRELNKVKKTLNKIKGTYSKHITRYILKTSIAENFPFLFKHLGRNVIDKKTPGAAELRPDSDFIKNFVASGLEQVRIPIRAIAGVLVDFSQLFSPFPSTIKKQELQKLNKVYANLIGGSPICEHDMLLPVQTQHAEGLRKRDFQGIKIYGTCHGNKVGVSVKQGLAELNNDKVIQAVTELIEESFYEEKQIEEEIFETEMAHLKEAGCVPYETKIM